MTETGDHHRPMSSVLMALSMTVGRGPIARTAVQLADLRPDDDVVDIGCGPGTVVRLAARRCARVTGVDPSEASLRLGRWISTLRRVHNVTFVSGTAEAIPVPDATASVVWSLNAYHHWVDPAAGRREVRRILAPGGRLLVVERLAEPGARGHGAHGISEDAAGRLAQDLEAAGYAGVRTTKKAVGRRRLIVVMASAPAPEGPAGAAGRPT